MPPEPVKLLSETEGREPELPTARVETTALDCLTGDALLPSGEAARWRRGDAVVRSGEHRRGACRRGLHTNDEPDEFVRVSAEGDEFVRVSADVRVVEDNFGLAKLIAETVFLDASKAEESTAPFLEGKSRIGSGARDGVALEGEALRNGVVFCSAGGARSCAWSTSISALAEVPDFVTAESDDFVSQEFDFVDEMRARSCFAANSNNRRCPNFCRGIVSRSSSVRDKSTSPFIA